MTYLKKLSTFESLLLYSAKIYPEMRISHPLHLLVFTMAILIAGQQSAAQKAGRAGRLAVSKMEKWVSPVGKELSRSDLSLILEG